MIFRSRNKQGTIMTAAWKTLSGPAAFFHKPSPLAPLAQSWDKAEHQSSKSVWSSPIPLQQSDSLDGKIVCPRDASHQSCVQFPSHCLCRKEFRSLSTLHIACLAEVRRPKTLSLNPSWKRQKALQSWQNHDRGMELLGCFKL